MIEIRHAEPKDLAAVVDLLVATEGFYGAKQFPAREDWERAIKSILFSNSPAAKVLLAIDGADPCAYASYSFLWPAAGITKSLYMKELFVQESYRRQGLGHAIVARLCKVAVDEGCSRVEWTTDRDNDAAVTFYAQLGVPQSADKVFYRLEGSDLLSLSGSHTSRDIIRGHKQC